MMASGFSFAVRSSSTIDPRIQNSIVKRAAARQRPQDVQIFQDAPGGIDNDNRSTSIDHLRPPLIDMTDTANNSGPLPKRRRIQK